MNKIYEIVSDTKEPTIVNVKGYDKNGNKISEEITLPADGTPVVSEQLTGLRSLLLFKNYKRFFDWLSGK